MKACRLLGKFLTEIIYSCSFVPPQDIREEEQTNRNKL